MNCKQQEDTNGTHLITNIIGDVKSWNVSLAGLFDEVETQGNLLFRGEPLAKKDEDNDVTSALFRRVDENKNGVGGNEFSLINLIEREYSTATKNYLPGIDPLERLARLQHYGSPTNLIDFTANIVVALFFACYKNKLNEGRLIALRYHGPETSFIQAGKEVVVDQGLSLYQPCNQPRVAAQHSIFVRPDKGRLLDDNYIELNDNEKLRTLQEAKEKWCWTKIAVPDPLKMLKALRDYYNVKEETIFADFYGLATRYSYFFDCVWKEIDASSKKTPEQEKTDPLFQQHADNILLYFKPIHALIQQRDYDGAYQKLGELIKRDPEHSTAYLWRGMINMRQDHRPAARDNLNNAIKWNPREAKAYELRAQCLIEDKKWVAAIEDLTKVLERSSPKPETYLSRAQCRTKIKEWEHAIADLDKAVELGSKDPNISDMRDLCESQLKERELEQDSLPPVAQRLETVIE